METILIHKNGTLSKQGKRVTDSVLKLMGNSICFEDGLTLGSVFKMLNTYPDLLNLSDVLESLLQIAQNNPAPGYKTDELDSLVFYKTIEIKGFPGKPSLNLYNSLKGVSAKGRVDLKFYHIEALLDHTLKLGHLEHVVFGDKEDSFSYETFYTLFELVEGIAWELSFNFNPLECSVRR